jgi:hypothetical protein
MEPPDAALAVFGGLLQLGERYAQVEAAKVANHQRQIEATHVENKRQQDINEGEAGREHQRIMAAIGIAGTRETRAFRLITGIVLALALFVGVLTYQDKTDLAFDVLKVAMGFVMGAVTAWAVKGKMPQIPS